MPLLNRLASFFGYQQPSSNALAQSMAPASGYSPVAAGYSARAMGSLIAANAAARTGGKKFTYGKTLAPWNEPLFVQGYRYDRRRDKLETLPKKFNMEDVRMYATAVGDAVRSGIPGISENISPEIVTAMLLKEGREDLGSNEFNTNDPESYAIYEKYRQDYGHKPAQLIAAMYDKAKVARRLNIPFASAWIGTGRSAYETSGQYAADTENFKKIATDKKNKSLLNFIRGSMMAEPGAE